MSKSAMLIGYVLRQAGVPMAELIAQMLSKVKATTSLCLYGIPADNGIIGLRSGDAVTLYNGAVLPKLPESEAPYTIIGEAGDRYYVELCKTLPVVFDNYTCAFGNRGDVYVAEGDNWVFSALARVVTVIWADFDVYTKNGSMYLTASDPIPVSGIVSYLYNGVPLLALPEWDKETYPFVFIARSWLGSYLAVATTEPAYIYDSSGECIGWETEALRSSYNAGAWGSWRDNSFSTNIALQDEPYVWANYDIKKNGNLWLAASDPVPVYE